jgi:predicted nucleic acid-binding protein
LIVVDTSALIDSLAGPRRSAPKMRSLIEEGERLVLPTLVLYEWWRGPRRSEELVAQEALFPIETALPFGVEQAAVASRLYRLVRRPRGREVDLAIAAHAISRDAQLWTLNLDDFEDIPGLAAVRLD